MIPALIATKGALTLMYKTDRNMSGLTKTLNANAKGFKSVAIGMRGMLAVGAPLIALIAAVTIKLVALQNEVDNWEDSMAEVDKRTDKSILTLKKFNKELDTMGSGDLQKGVNELITQHSDLERQLNRVNSELVQAKEDYKGSIISGEIYGSMVTSLEYKIKDLTFQMKNNTTMQSRMVDKGNELAKVKEKELKITNREIAKKKEVAKANAALLKSNQATLDSSVSSLNAREKTLETTLISMLSKEKKYAKEIANLEAETATIRKDFVNRRLDLDLDLESKLNSVKQKGMSSIEKYNDSQLQADKYLNQAKAALQEKNLVMFKSYMSKYNSLIEVSAGEEIATDDEVHKTRMQTMGVYQAKAKEGYSLEKQALLLEEQATLKAHNAKIAMKKLEMSSLIQQMVMQKEMISLTADLISQATGVEVKLDFSAYERSLANYKASMEEISSKQREVKIDANTKPAEQELNALNDMAINPNVELGGVSEAQAEIEELSDDEITTVLVVQMTEAEREMVDFQRAASKETKSLHKANINSANSSIDSFRNKAQKNTYSTHIVTVKTLQAAQTGGMILPRFNEGGHLDDGVGHSRKSGKLSGYGGGDKVKALLEAGEFIIRKEAVKSLGLDRLYQLNQGLLPRYQDGGHVAAIQRFNTGGQVNSSVVSNSNTTVDLNLNIGSSSFKMKTTSETANELAFYLDTKEF